jgi:hypothetical protein
MDSWRGEIAKTIETLMPYAFTVDGRRIEPDEEEMRVAIGFINEQVMGLMKKAYRAGFECGATSDLTPEALATISYISDQAFEQFRHEKRLDNGCVVTRIK